MLDKIKALISKKQAELDKLPDYLEATTEEQETQIVRIGHDIRELKRAVRIIGSFESELVDSLFPNCPKCGEINLQHPLRELCGPCEFIRNNNKSLRQEQLTCKK